MAEPTRDLIGIYAICITILLALFGLGASGFYWAGQMARGLEEQKEQIRKLELKVDKAEANYVILNLQYTELKASLDILSYKRIKP